MDKAFEQVFEVNEEVNVPQLLLKIPQIMEVYTDLEMEAFKHMMAVDEEQDSRLYSGPIGDRIGGPIGGF